MQGQETHLCAIHVWVLLPNPVRYKCWQASWVVCFTPLTRWHFSVVFKFCPAHTLSHLCMPDRLFCCVSVFVFYPRWHGRFNRMRSVFFWCSWSACCAVFLCKLVSKDWKPTLESEMYVVTCGTVKATIWIQVHFQLPGISQRGVESKAYTALAQKKD